MFSRKCKHEVLEPTKLEIHTRGYGRSFLYYLDDVVKVDVEGVCYKCNCLVSITEDIQNSYLYKYFKKLERAAQEKECST